MNSDKKTNYIIYGLIIVLILFGFYVSFSDNRFINQSQTYQYTNGYSVFDVRRVSDSESEIKIFLGDNPTPYIISTRYDPARLEDVEIHPDGLNAVKDDKHVYFAIDPEENLTGKSVIAVMELGKFLSNSHLFNIPSSGAVTKPYKDRTVMTCKQANQFTSVIELRLGEKNSVYSDGPGCIIIEGENEDGLIKGADRLALFWLGVMK